MDAPNLLRPLCLALAGLSIFAGGMGMLASFLVMASNTMHDVTAGAAGFVAGSVLIGSGLVSLTMLAVRPTRPASKYGESELA